MKRFPWWVGIGVVISTLVLPGAFAQNDPAWRAGVTEDLRSLNESVRRLSDQMTVLENRYANLESQLQSLRSELRALSAASPAVAPKDIERLDAELRRLDGELKRLDELRQKERTALVEQVAKLLDDFRKKEMATANPPSAGGQDGLRHTVQKGENLTTIAKTYAVTVAEIQRANKLVTDVIRPGQVLVIPKKD